MKPVTSKTFFAILVASLSLSLVSCKEEPKENTAQETATETSEPETSLLKARAKYVLGQVKWFKNKKNDWRQLHVGAKVSEQDKISTAAGSDATLEFPDGSAVVFGEHTDVLLGAEEKDGQRSLVLFDIRNGNVRFDIQKQKNREVKFTTGTAAASIRGTLGFVGNTHNKMVVSLKEGLVDVTEANGKSSSIAMNQTAVEQSGGQMQILNLKSSGTKALAKKLDSLLAEDDAKNAALLEDSLKKFDDEYVAAQKSFEKKLQFRATKIGDTLYIPSITLQAHVSPGVTVTVWGESVTVGENGIYQQTFNWADSTYGTKRFFVECSDGYVEIPCYMWVAEYVAANGASGESESASVENVADSASVKSASADEAKDEVTVNNINIKMGGGRNERIHLDLPATEYSTNLKFSLSGVTAAQLGQIRSVAVLRNGKTFKNFAGNELTSLNYEVPVSIARNRIADFEVVATLKNGKKFRAKKTYEVYCLVSNHPGGKARNSIVPKEQEYERLKQSGALKHE